MKKPPPRSKKVKFECPICKRVESENDDDLILHIVNHHKLVNSLKHDLSLNKAGSSNLNLIKCIKCHQTFQDNDTFFIHLFKNHLYDVIKTIEHSRLRENSKNIKDIFENIRSKKTQSLITTSNEKSNLPDIDYIVTIEYWEQARISNQVDSEVQTDQSSVSQYNRIRSKQSEQQNNSNGTTSKDEKNEANSYLSSDAKRIYEADNQNYSNFINTFNDDVNIRIKSDDDNDDDDEYLSFIASTIDTSNVRLQNGKMAPSAEERKKTSSDKLIMDKKKEEGRRFFDKLEQVTDMLILQKIIVNNQTHHKCLKCNLDFDNEFMLMKHIWDYHNEDDPFLY